MRSDESQQEISTGVKRPPHRSPQHATRDAGVTLVFILGQHRGALEMGR